MPADARVSAWVAAWERLDAANKLMKEHRELPAAHKERAALVEEAKVLAELASAPEDIGLAAGEWYQRQYEREQESKRHIDEMLNKYRAKGDTDARH